MNLDRHTENARQEYQPELTHSEWCFIFRLVAYFLIVSAAGWCIEPKIHMCAQGDLEWTRLRLGRPTASEFDALLTPEFKSRTGEGVRTYLAEKVAEKWLGHALPGFSSYSTEQGQLLEHEALSWFAFDHDCTPRQVGFVESADGRCGCSPDALIGDDGGLEIKCPEAHTHTAYLLDGTLPKKYAAQVHGSLYVTGRKSWTFLSYRRGFPKLVLTIERDEEIMSKIAAALAPFYTAFDKAIELLTRLDS